MSNETPSATCPLPDEVQNQILSLRQRRGTLRRGRRPRLGLCLSLHLEPGWRERPHTFRKWHLQVKHEVVKPFFRNTVMETHCKRGDGTDINREKTRKSYSSPPWQLHPCPILSASLDSLLKEWQWQVAACPAFPNSRLCGPGQRDTQTLGPAFWSSPQTVSNIGKKEKLRG